MNKGGKGNTKKILREELDFDSETGEIRRLKTEVQFDKEPDYVKLYLDCLGAFSGNEGLNITLNDMLREVLKLATYADDDGMVISLSAYHKERICKKTGKSLRRLEQAITTWTNSQILSRVQRGTYKLNPWIFGKGDWRDICKLRATFDFVTGKVVTEREKEAKEKEEDGQVLEITKEEEIPNSLPLGIQIPQPNISTVGRHC